MGQSLFVRREPHEHVHLETTLTTPKKDAVPNIFILVISVSRFQKRQKYIEYFVLGPKLLMDLNVDVFGLSYFPPHLEGNAADEAEVQTRS